MSKELGVMNNELVEILITYQDLRKIMKKRRRVLRLPAE